MKKRPLKIVHCGNFTYFRNGELFYLLDRRISQGFTQNGHMVYDFSYRDQARGQRFLGFKKTSIKKMNADLIEVCNNIKPHLLFLGKAESIFPETLAVIKKLHPEIKIAKWYVDWMAEKANFFGQFKYLDCFFATDGKILKELSVKYSGLTKVFCFII